MNRPVRNQFLNLLRSLVQPTAEPAAEPNAMANRHHSKRLRNHVVPRVESLEDRRVMAANITQFTPTDSGFVVQFSEAIDAAKINLYTTSGGAMGAAD